MLEVLQIIAARLERIEILEAFLLRSESHHVNLERHIMSLEQALIDAAGTAQAAIGGLTTKVDTLIAVAKSSADALAALVHAGDGTISSDAAQKVIDNLNAATATANAEADKVAAAITADTPTPVVTDPPVTDPAPVDPAPVDPAPVDPAPAS